MTTRSNTMTVQKAYHCNLITAGLVLFSVLWMFSGIQIGGGTAALTASRWGMFRYYTVDSNVIMGLVALAVALEQSKVLAGQQQAPAPSMYVLKLIGVVGVTLTMLVTVFFLAPTFENGWVTCFNNSNFFLHLVNPLLSIYTFLRYEGTTAIPKKHTITGIVTMVIYACFYVANCALHAEGQIVPKSCDWYGFLVMGLNSVFIVLPVIFLVTYIISYVLWRANRRMGEK